MLGPGHGRYFTIKSVKEEQGESAPACFAAGSGRGMHVALVVEEEEEEEEMAAAALPDYRSPS